MELPSCSDDSCHLSKNILRIIVFMHSTSLERWRERGLLERTEVHLRKEQVDGITLVRRTVTKTKTKTKTRNRNGVRCVVCCRRPTNIRLDMELEPSGQQESFKSSSRSVGGLLCKPVFYFFHRFTCLASLTCAPTCQKQPEITRNNDLIIMRWSPSFSAALLFPLLSMVQAQVGPHPFPALKTPLRGQEL